MPAKGIGGDGTARWGGIGPIVAGPRKDWRAVLDGTGESARPNTAIAIPFRGDNSR